MKSILITAVVIGAVVASLIYLANESQKTPLERAGDDLNDAVDDIGDAASDAYDSMNRNIGRADRAANSALNGSL